MNKINTNTVCDFLKGYENKSRTYILSESKSDKDKKLKKELIAVAKAKGIIVENSKDLAVFKTVYTFADKANGNHDMMPEDELLKALPTIIGKSINIDHIQNLVVGHYIDYKYIEKSKSVIAYGIFFKSAFGKEYIQAKAMLEKGTLATSHEVWNDEDKLEILADGTNVLHDLEFAGGALVLNDQPAFKDTKVLALSTKVKEVINGIKINMEEIKKQPKRYSLVYASLTKEAQKTLNTNKRKILTASSFEQTLEAPRPLVDNQIICQKCSENFTYQFIEGAINDIKCPSCYCILDKSGAMIYPSQKLNFDLTCEKCKSRNGWLIKKDNGKSVEVECLECKQNYEISFRGLTEKDKLLKNISYLKETTYKCLQCDKNLSWNGVSTTKHATVYCPDCNLTRNIDLTIKEYKRKIEKITSVKKSSPVEEIKPGEKLSTDPNIEINKIGGENDMDKLAVAKLLRKAVSKINDLKAKQLKSKKLLEKKELKGKKYLAGAKKFSTQIKELRKEVKSKEAKNLATIDKAEKDKKFYMEQAKELQKRKSTLGDFEHCYNDLELMDNLKYDLALSKLKIAEQDKEIKANKTVKPKLNTASLKVTEGSDEWYKEQRTAIDAKCFGVEK